MFFMEDDQVKRVNGLLLTDSVHGRLTGDATTDDHLIKVCKEKVRLSLVPHVSDWSELGLK